MVSVLLAVGIAQGAGQGPATPDWASQLLRSKPALAAESKPPPPRRPAGGMAKALAPGAQTTATGHGNARDDPVFAERLATSNKARRQAGGLMYQGRIAEADRCLSIFLGERPDLNDFLADQITDCDLLLDRYRQAFARVVPIVNTRGSDSEEMYLRLSLAAAAQGQVYPGQRDYCYGYMRRRYADHHGAKPLDPHVQGAGDNSPRSVALLSCLALGLGGSIANRSYLELALKLDPNNVLAASEAIQEYDYRGKYSDIRRIASAMIARLPDGPARKKFQQDIADAANLKDRPWPPIDVDDPSVIHP